MKTSTVLKKSLALLEGDGVRPNWTKDTLARNKYRHSVKVDNPNAMRFCAEGAVCRVLGESGDELPSDAYRNAVNYLRSEVPLSSDFWNNSVNGFNDRDTTKFEDVRQLFKRAIKAAKGDGN